MNIKIKSIQVYEDTKEEFEEVHVDSKIKFLDKLLVINYNDNEIVYRNDENIVEIKRDKNNIFIQLQKEMISAYETPYGTISLKTIGEKIDINKQPFSMYIEYKIILGDTKGYKNIIEIVEV